MTRVIIDGDACPVVDSVIELTTGTGILLPFYVALAITQIKCSQITLKQFILMMDLMSDYKIVKLATPEDIVITQDYGLASLLLSKVKIVMHHKGHLYRSSNIDMLLQQRYNNAQIRKQGGRHKGPPLFKRR